MSNLNYTVHDEDGVTVYEGFSRLGGPNSLDPSYQVAMVYDEGEWELWLIDGKTGADSLMQFLREQRHDGAPEEWLAPPMIVMPLGAQVVDAKRQHRARYDQADARRVVWNSLTDRQRHRYLDETDPAARQRMWRRFVERYEAGQLAAS